MPPSSSNRKRNRLGNEEEERPRRKSGFACDACRRRKLKCDGKQPKCVHCTRLGKRCEYAQPPSINDMAQLQAYCDRLEAQLQQQSCHDCVRTGGLAAASVAPTTTATTPTGAALSEQIQAVNQTLAAEQVAGLTSDDFGYLLACHWSFVHPFYSILYRPALPQALRSSPFLLYAILAHASRFNLALPSGSFREQCDIFTSTATRLMLEALQQPSQVATIQGLLLLSGVAFSAARPSPAWMYGGMAFRQLIDLGYHLEVGHRHQEQSSETRRRLFWACYLWDKCLGLYFGRAPALVLDQNSPELEFTHDETEDEEWKPVGVEWQVEAKSTRAVSCFTYTCKLAQIVEGVLQSRYHTSTDIRKAGLVAEQAHRLSQWRAALPAHLELEDDSLPMPHIINLHCLYHACVILNAQSVSQQVTSWFRHDALESARATLHIARRAKQTYGQYRFTVAAFSVWQAVALLVEELLAPAPPSAERGSTLDQIIQAVDLLDSLIDFCPGIANQLDSIRAKIEHLRQREAAPLSSDNFDSIIQLLTTSISANELDFFGCV